MEQLKDILATNPELETALAPVIEKMVETAVVAANDKSATKIAELTASLEAVQGNSEKLLDEKKQTEKQHKQLKDRLAELGGNDVFDEMVKIRQQLGDSSLDAYVETKTAEAEAGSAEELASLQKEIAELDAHSARRELAYRITQAAGQVGANPGAHDDIVRFAEASGIRFDGGNLVSGDGDDTAEVNAAEWLESLRDSRSHYWPPSEGGGASGSRGQQGFGGFTLTRSEAQDHHRYAQAREDAARSGKSVQITDD